MFVCSNVYYSIEYVCDEQEREKKNLCKRHIENKLLWIVDQQNTTYKSYVQLFQECQVKIKKKENLASVSTTTSICIPKRLNLKTDD